jgi:uncharacterized protein YcaQ
VQIDTIHVIERCHHHILFTRIPAYRREDLHRAQSADRSVFEYWTHALSYVPTRDFRYYAGAMRKAWRRRCEWFGSLVTNAEVRRVVERIRAEGPLTVRDIDEPLAEKRHAWDIRKPSKRALQVAFFRGFLTISRREGMLKTYELTGRHFGWDAPPPAATEREVLDHLLDRALRTQGVVSVESACYLDPARKPAVRALIAARVRRGTLVPVALEGAGKQQHWAEPAALDEIPVPDAELVHLLSPFDPLIRDRRRLRLFFDYEHVFEAYVPKEKRRFGYFTLPVLVGDRVVAGVDLKTDRERGRLLVQQWTWLVRDGRRELRKRIEGALDRFERFQLAR